MADASLPPGLPPGPALSRARQTARWIAQPLEFLAELRERHGDLFTLHLQREPPWVVVGDPELVKRIFTAPADQLHAGVSKRILEPVVGSRSVLIEDGEEHMRRRRLLLPPFHGDRVSGYERTMRAVAAAEIGRWPRGVPAPAGPRMSAIALETVLRVAFGDATGRRGSPLHEAFERLVGYLSGSARSALVALGESARLGEGRFSELGEQIARVDELVLAAIAERRAAARGEPAGDVLSLLLEARYDDGSAMADGDLRDQLTTLVVAGHDTTATSLAWALERLVRDRAALRRVTAEAAAGGGPYTDAVVRETLRLRPVFLVAPRLAVRPFRLGDLEIPPGVAAVPAIPLVHGRADVYPDPAAFRPDRFLDRPPGTYTWIPFGGGIRRCIGAGFALLEMRVVLSTLLAGARLRAPDPAGEPQVRQGLLVAPASGARLTLEPR